MQRDQRATILVERWKGARGKIGIVKKIGTFPGNPRTAAAMIRSVEGTDDSPQWAGWFRSREFSVQVPT